VNCFSTLQMLVVTELEEPFLPLPDELLVNLKDSRPVVEALLDALPSTYSSSTSSDSAMGPALQVTAPFLGLACACVPS
jgi:protein transport protein SEC24